MWKCNHCKKTVDAELIDCWNCGYSQEGLPPGTEVLSQIKEVKEEQKLERENEKYRADRLKNKASSLRLPAIAVAGIFMFLLFFHIVPAHLTVFPKRSPSFADTFVDVDEYIKRYNDQNIIGMLAMQATPLYQQLAERGLIVSKSKTNN
jgi:hypothetical protein